jgi:hypothetical protein
MVCFRPFAGQEIGQINLPDEYPEEEYKDVQTINRVAESVQKRIIEFYPWLILSSTSICKEFVPEVDPMSNRKSNML